MKLEISVAHQRVLLILIMLVLLPVLSNSEGELDEKTGMS